MNSGKRGCFMLFGFSLLVLGVLFFNRLMKAGNNQASTNQSPAASISQSNQEVIDASIPGVMPVDIYLNLENQGFTTTKELSPCCSWYSMQGGIPVKFAAETFGNSPNSFYRVNASTVTTIDKDTKAISLPFFKYLAGLQYTGSEPSFAQSWVMKNIGKNAKTKIGAVTFELSKGQPNGLSLSMYTEK